MSATPTSPGVESIAETYILGEGFSDRAFWKGMLTERGCTDDRVDPFTSTDLKKGAFGFRSPRGQFLRVVRASVTELVKFAKARLEDHRTRRLQRLVISFDNDEMADGGESQPQLTPQGVFDALQADQRFDTAREHGRIYCWNGEVPVDLIVWRVDEAPALDLPNKQTLERLVCAAVRDIEPLRTSAVANWLAERPQPRPDAGAKEHSMSHMAGWYASHGSYDFYEHLWRDAALSAALKRRLGERWTLIEEIAR